MKMILVIEDYVVLSKMWRKLLSDVAFVLTAETLQQGQELFNKHKEGLDLVAVDGEVHGSVNNTVVLVKKIVGEFPSSKILAISGDPDNNKILIKAGCEHSVIKQEVVGKIRELLSK
ncbi:MAG: hypothetical protein UR79_C0001G0254 [Candidatus Campbellbacteria bacterium GW2011_GWD1_35_49]|nr:MAG: Signal transduction response regulator, receiver-like protein [Candidatus Campbellbacteria bacterium GW2011_OD1_34_28]KKP75219.1 MAG: hypothetical protein UR74_C0001G0075 [Candidatus Campbellbacteria bacterium GW2011_GWD2_35_24]KKP76220.1 MAG: seg [Candidatus Campbellbacteria bacterium GW2011_GWC2_35_28]KKP77409.1 MAG: hypothetical protein UR76_C0001G0254 [Candidatus Campbellbacteria bacterium GW2011_GWC1_35_31]KKP79338.1 MAG: hypothetical protein UR79_C0001G0254 [Candidatus Campbellbac